ncbi:hypothetical protein [Micromonospora sp. LH3U1]|uniref:hypothetical protein n=1 Tax=Micromonospora sp. LH3U1 TaxID=3018339 RepID=UPI0023491F80|nr:hypothetical protein [Micromonospora sp. LH3U1]WCN79058.1 hypothetical protein PCA76_18745 [Micromonospora sp. LH3U1]
MTAWEAAGLPAGIDDLVAGSVLDRDLAVLAVRLDQAQQDTRLPEQPAGSAQLNDLVVAARLAETAVRPG